MYAYPVEKLRTDLICSQIFDLSAPVLVIAPDDIIRLVYAPVAAEIILGQVVEGRQMIAVHDPDL